MKKVKTINDKRIKSGIPNLDKLIGDGFEKNSINLIKGKRGIGKSIFGIQFIIEGLKNKERCLYVSFEEKKKTFYSNMKKLSWDLEEYEKKGLFTYLEYTPEKVNLMLEEGGGSIESIVLTKGITRLVIDCLTSFALLFKDELERQEAVLSLSKMIREWGCTTIFTLEEDDNKDYDSQDFESDSIIHLHYIMTKGERKRYLDIAKMRGVEHSEKVYEFEIKRGINIKSKPASDSIAYLIPD